MSNQNRRLAVLVPAVLAYFVSYPEDAEAVAAPIRSFLHLTTTVSPWFYGVVAVGIFSAAVAKTWSSTDRGR